MKIPHPNSVAGICLIGIAIIPAFLFHPVFSKNTGVLPPFSTRIKVEITSLELAIQKFKKKYGSYPPSRVKLHERADDWESDWESRVRIRRLWPKFDFDRNRDINGDGDEKDSLELTGAECLRFFIGGLIRDGKEIGFSTDPEDPFSDSENRWPSFCRDCDFDLIDVDSDGVPEYCPKIPAATAPYLYISANHGDGYDLADLNIYGNGDERNMIDVYRRDDVDATPWYEHELQIIYSGPDNLFGTGGRYEPPNWKKYLVNHWNGRKRLLERDNITNFSWGPLGN